MRVAFIVIVLLLLVVACSGIDGMPDPPGPLQTGSILTDWIANHRNLFHWKYSGVFIPLFGGTGLAMVGLGSFSLAYLFVFAGAVWSICYWLTSDFLDNKRRRIKKSRRTKQISLTNYAAWKYGVTVAIVMLLCLSIEWIREIREEKELLELHGWLIPANDPFPPTPSSCRNIPADAMRLYFGSNLLYTRRFPFPVLTSIKGGHKILLEKNDDGQVTITMDVYDDNENVVAAISKGEFNINPHGYFKIVRKDRSSLSVTIPKRKEEVLNLKYLNPSAIKLRGIFRYPGLRRIIITEDYYELDGSAYKGGCFHNLPGLFLVD